MADIACERLIEAGCALHSQGLSWFRRMDLRDWIMDKYPDVTKKQWKNTYNPHIQAMKEPRPKHPPSIGSKYKGTLEWKEEEQTYALSQYGRRVGGCEHVGPPQPGESQAKATAQIFLSYARKDEEKVENLYRKLFDAGFKPWMDEKDILPGEVWQTCIQKAMRRSDFFLACLSAHSVNKRGYLQKEIRDALDIWQEKLEDDIYLIPVQLEDCEVPENLRDFQWVNLLEEDGWTRLVQAIRVGMKRRAEVPADERLSSSREMATPQEDPERIKKVERLADEIRRFACENYIKPARERGEKQITMRTGDVHKEMRLVSRIPAVCSALGTNEFQDMCGIQLIRREGPTNASNVYFTFKLG